MSVLAKLTEDMRQFLGENELGEMAKMVNLSLLSFVVDDVARHIYKQQIGQEMSCDAVGVVALGTSNVSLDRAKIVAIRTRSGHVSLISKSNEVLLKFIQDHASKI